MKFKICAEVPSIHMSRPVWGAWIEIRIYPGAVTEGRKSRPVWGAWIEMPRCMCLGGT